MQLQHSDMCPPVAPVAVQDNVFVMMVVSVQYQVMPGSLYDAFYRVSLCITLPT